MQEWGKSFAVVRSGCIIQCVILATMRGNCMKLLIYWLLQIVKNHLISFTPLHDENQYCVYRCSVSHIYHFKKILRAFYHHKSVQLVHYHFKKEFCTLYKHKKGLVCFTDLRHNSGCTNTRKSSMLQVQKGTLDVPCWEGPLHIVPIQEVTLHIAPTYKETQYTVHYKWVSCTLSEGTWYDVQ